MRKKVNERRNKLIKPPHNSYVGMQAAIRELEDEKPKAKNSQADHKLIHAISELKCLPIRIKDSFEKLGEQATLKKQDLLAFKFHRGEINRRAETPVVMDTIMLMSAFWVVEASLAGVVYSLEGKMSIEQGFGYGAVFSFCNIAIGLSLGWSMRYAHIIYHDHIPVKTVHKRALVVIIILSILLLILILSGSRTRALARSNDIWNFQELSFLATYSDSFTIIFAALAAITSLAAIWKGATAFSDFIVGFTAEQKAADEIDAQGEDLAADYEDLVDELYENAITEFEESQVDPADVEDYQTRRAAVLEQIERHNIDVIEGQIGLQDLNRNVTAIKPQIQMFPTDLSHLLIDVEVVEKRLALPAIEPQSEDLLAELDNAHSATQAAIKTVLITYLNSDKAQEVA